MEKFKFNRQSNSLFKAILALKDIKEAENFFRDLCTVDELKEMTERWAIVQLLKQDKSYRDIAAKLNVSTTTVSRVAAWLNYGEGGYELIYNRVHQHDRSPAGKGSR